MKQRVLQQAEPAMSRTMRTSSCRGTAPTGFICAFFATFMGFALIWHIWWLVAVGLPGRLRDIRRVRLARPHRGSHSGRRGRPHRPGQPARPQRGARPDAARAMSAAQGTAGTLRLAEHAARGVASKRIIVGYGFWIFLLSDIIMFSAFFATYAVLSGETAGGPSGKDLFHLHIVAIETACLLLSSFTCGVASIGARAHNDLMYYGSMAVTAVLGAGVPVAGDARVRRHGRAGRRADAQRLPVGLLHPGRLPRPARDARPAVAADHDGAGVRQGLPRRHPAPRPVLQLCSGTRWTSSGSAIFTVVYLMGVAQ